MKMKKTGRGFTIYSEIKDAFGQTITVQESSNAEKHCVWIFAKNRFGDEVVDCVGAKYNFSAVSPHLTKSQARKLAKALLKFADAL